MAHEGVELAFQAPVIEAALFLRAAAEGVFEAGIGGNGAKSPGGMALMHESQVPVQITAGGLIPDPLAVGRIAEEDAVFLGQGQGLEGLNGQGMRCSRPA